MRSHPSSPALFAALVVPAAPACARMRIRLGSATTVDTGEALKMFGHLVVATARNGSSLSASLQVER